MTSVYEKEVTSHYSKQTISKKTIAVYIVALRYEFYIFPLELTLFYSHLLQKQDLKLYSTFSYFFPFFFFSPPPLFRHEGDEECHQTARRHLKEMS